MLHDMTLPKITRPFAKIPGYNTIEIKPIGPPLNIWYADYMTEKQWQISQRYNKIKKICSKLEILSE